LGPKYGVLIKEDFILCDYTGGNYKGGWLYCIINRTSASHGDAFLRLDINLHNNSNEVQQYKKWTKNTLNESNFIKECEKSSSLKDFFLLFTTMKVNNFELPENSSLIDSSNWRKYFGAFASKMFAYHRLNDEASGDEVSVKYWSNIKSDMLPANHFKNCIHINTQYDNDIWLILIQFFKNISLKYQRYLIWNWYFYWY